MIHKAILVLTAFMFVWISCLFYATVRPIFFEKEKDLYIPYDEVIHIALLKNGNEEILNFDQEMLFLQQLNKLKSLNFILRNKKNEILFFDKIIIYRFNEENLNILPLKATECVNIICLNNL